MDVSLICIHTKLISIRLERDLPLVVKKIILTTKPASVVPYCSWNWLLNPLTSFAGIPISSLMKSAADISLLAERCIHTFDSGQHKLDDCLIWVQRLVQVDEDMLYLTCTVSHHFLPKTHWSNNSLVSTMLEAVSVILRALPWSQDYKKFKTRRRPHASPKTSISTQRKLPPLSPLHSRRIFPHFNA